MFFFFFFSSRRRHTRFDCEWSSDVCSSDLLFARYILDVGPAGYGMLTAMAGFGALVAGLWGVTMGNVRRRGRPGGGGVMGLRAGVVISLPLGNFLAGAAAERFGAALAQGAYAASALFIMLGIVLLVPSVHKLE